MCHVINKTFSSQSERANAPIRKPLLDSEASAHFLAEETSSEDERQEDSSTEILFSVLNSRNR